MVSSKIPINFSPYGVVIPGFFAYSYYLALRQKEVILCIKMFIYHTNRK
jgi:hypothetical protein